MVEVSREENKLKRVMMQVGILITAEDGIRPDVLMTYAMNSLNMTEQTSGQIREVQVREVAIPSIELIREDDNTIDLTQLGSGSAKH